MIGFQLSEKIYLKLLPTPVLEKPYDLSFISVFSNPESTEENSNTGAEEEGSDNQSYTLIWDNLTEENIDR